MRELPITIDFSTVSCDLQGLNKDIEENLAKGGEISTNQICAWYDRYREIQREMTKLRNHFYICGLKLARVSEGGHHGENS